MDLSEPTLPAQDLFTAPAVSRGVYSTVTTADLREPHPIIIALLQRTPMSQVGTSVLPAAPLSRPYHSNSNHSNNNHRVPSVLAGHFGRPRSFSAELALQVTRRRTEIPLRKAFQRAT